MSMNEWEQGIITLPAAEVAPLKAVLRKHVNTLHEDVRMAAVNLHKEVGKGTRSVTLYTERLRAASDAWNAANAYGVSHHNKMVKNIAFNILLGNLRDKKVVSSPTIQDISFHAPKATSSTNEFDTMNPQGYFEEGSIYFEGREVTWEVDENNHAVEFARATPLAIVFFDALKRVKWTRGTGGHFVGNNEANQASDHSGGGANYITSTFGPKGNEELILGYMRQGFTRKNATKIVADTRRYR